VHRGSGEHHSPSLADSHPRRSFTVTDHSARFAQGLIQLCRTDSGPTAGARAVGPPGWIMMTLASGAHRASIALM
jgi:hypothetical protein